MNRDSINFNNDNVHYETLDAHKRKCNKGKGTWKYPSVFNAGATLAVKQEDGRLWTHGVIVKPNNNDHRGHSCTIE